MTDTPAPRPVGHALMGMPPPKRGRQNTRREVGGFEREKDDFYPTPPTLTRPLLRLERFDGDVWECACGDGAIGREFTGALRLRDKCINTDLVYRGYGRGGVDFLMERALLAPNIVTNPPFKMWRAFAEHAHALGAEKVVFLGRLLNLEGAANRRMFEATGLTRIWIATRRVNFLPPGALSKGHGTVIAYAWFVWQRGHTGPWSGNFFTPDKD